MAHCLSAPARNLPGGSLALLSRRPTATGARASIILIKLAELDIKMLVPACLEGACRIGRWSPSAQSILKMRLEGKNWTSHRVKKGKNTYPVRRDEMRRKSNEEDKRTKASARAVVVRAATGLPAEGRRSRWPWGKKSCRANRKSRRRDDDSTHEPSRLQSSNTPAATTTAAKPEPRPQADDDEGPG